MARSIAEQLSFATAVVVAAPITLAGLDMTLRGELTWGPVLLGVSVMILLVEKYVSTPQDLPGMAAAKAVGIIAKEPEDDLDATDSEH